MTYIESVVQDLVASMPGLIVSYANDGTLLAHVPSDPHAVLTISPDGTATARALELLRFMQDLRRSKSNA
jgi:hypothetical protein